MRVLVCGATGCVGRATVHALRSRGHHVVEGARRLPNTPHSLPLDYMQAVTPTEWAQTLQRLRIEAVVNCVGILMPSASQTFERVHTEGPQELFRGAALAGVGCVVQVSALGVSADPACLARPYLASKLRADDALASLGIDWAVLRPALIYGPHSHSGALFATLASLPVISLPGRGQQAVQPVHVFEVAEAITRLIEGRAPRGRVHELGGAVAMPYRDMLQAYRQAQGYGPALWLPLPMPLMTLTAWAAEALPQHVLCRDTIALLAQGSVPSLNAAAELLGRAPSTLAKGLQVSPPQPLIDLRIDLSPGIDRMLRASLALMWLWTAIASLIWPADSGVLALLTRCGLNSTSTLGALAFSCALNIGMGVWIWRWPSPGVYALQALAVAGYTLAGVLTLPALRIDHGGPLVTNLPVLGVIMVLWLSKMRAPAPGPGLPQALNTQTPKQASHSS